MIPIEESGIEHDFSDNIFNDEEFDAFALGP